MRFAGIEPFVAILVAVGWFIVKALFDRRRDADEWTELELPRPTRPVAPPPLPTQQTRPMAPRPAAPPIQRNVPPVMKPRSVPPPIARRPEVIRPVIIQDEPEGPTRAELARLRESQESYARAANLQASVASRLSAIDQQTAAHKPVQPVKRARPASAAHLLRTFRNPTTVRQAFLAQFVLNPPKALE
jgi:hypothetical protein